MIISGSDLALGSAHTLQGMRQDRASLRQWVGQRPELPDAAAVQAERARRSHVPEPIRSAPPPATADTPSSDMKCFDPDEKQRATLDLIERLFGIRNVASASISFSMTHEEIRAGSVQSQVSTSAGWGSEFDYHSEYHEYESTAFAAAGTITTADGRSFVVSFSFLAQREFHQTLDVSMRGGDAIVPKDPLVINWGGGFDPGAPFQFDVDSDGALDRMTLPTSSAFLAYDRDGDGTIRDGRELFGPSTGDGFGELGLFDHDHNGWIDEADPIWRDLRLFTGSDQPLLKLTDLSIGAIGLANVTMPFTLRDAVGERLAQNRAGGLYLREDGTPGLVHQLDVIG
jgi:hypothetical protein